MQNYNNNNNGKNLLDKISDLDPKLITDADKKPRRKSKLLIGITSGMATVAAAAMIAVAARNIPTKVPPVVDTSDPISSSDTGSSDTIDSNSGSVSDPNSQSDPANDPPKLDFSKYKDLPKISTGDYNISGMGKAPTTYDVRSRELEASSPWNNAELETMPVYMSSSTELSNIEKMYARAKEIAAALGIPENELTITDNYEDMTAAIEYQRKAGKEAGDSDEEIEEVIRTMIRSVMGMTFVDAQADGIFIHLDGACKAEISFDEPVELPEGCSLSFNAAAEEKTAALNYLADKYKALTGYSKPAAGYARDKGSYIYEADGELTGQIVNYWINTTQFEVDEDTGELKITISSDYTLEKLADYPILTAEQAEQILKSNKYDAENRMSADAKIVKTELVYDNHAAVTAVIPYYEFYVQTDETPKSGQLVCKVYTIPAVPEEFIDMETRDYDIRA